MNCSKAYKLFEYSLNNKLSNEQIPEFNAHLQQCEHCSKIFNEVETTYNAVDFLKPSLPFDYYFYARLSSAIENQKSHKQLLAFAKLKPALITTWFFIAFAFGIALGSNFIDAFDIVKYTYSSSESINDDSFIDVFNLSEVDKESLEYLLLQ